MGQKLIPDELYEWKAFFVANTTNPNFSPEMQDGLAGGWEFVSAQFVPGGFEVLARRAPAV